MYSTLALICSIETSSFWLVELGHRLAHPLGGPDLGGVARAQEVEGHHLLAVEAGHAARFGPVVLDRAQVAQAHGAAARQGDQGLAQLLDRAGRAEGADGALGARHGDASAGQVGVDAGQGLADRGRRHAVGGQTVGIQLDPDLAVHAALTVDLAHAGHGQQFAADRVVDVPAELFRAHGRRADHIGDQGVAGDVDALDRRLLHVLRQVGAQPGHGVAHVIGGALGVGAQLEFDGGGRKAVAHIGVDAAHAGQAR